MSEPKLTLPEVREALVTVLGEFGPDQLTDGVHGHLTWLLDLVEGCLEEG